MSRIDDRRARLRSLAYDLTADVSDLSDLASRNFDYEKVSHITCAIVSGSALSRALIRVAGRKVNWRLYETASLPELNGKIFELAEKPYPINLVLVDSFADDTPLEVISHLRKIEGGTSNEIIAVLARAPRGPPEKGIEIPSNDIDAREGYQAGYDLVYDEPFTLGLAERITNLLLSAESQWKYRTQRTVQAVSNHLQIRSVLGEVTDRFYDPSQQELVRALQHRHNNGIDTTEQRNVETTLQVQVDASPPDCIDTHPQFVQLQARYEHLDANFRKARQLASDKQQELKSLATDLEAEQLRIVEVSTENASLRSALERASVRDRSQERSELIKKRNADAKKIKALETNVKDYQSQLADIQRHFEAITVKLADEKQSTANALKQLDESLQRNKQLEESLSLQTRRVQAMRMLSTVSAEKPDRKTSPPRRLKQDYRCVAHLLEQQIMALHDQESFAEQVAEQAPLRENDSRISVQVSFVPRVSRSRQETTPTNVPSTFEAKSRPAMPIDKAGTDEHDDDLINETMRLASLMRVGNNAMEPLTSKASCVTRTTQTEVSSEPDPFQPQYLENQLPDKGKLEDAQCKLSQVFQTAAEAKTNVTSVVAAIIDEQSEKFTEQELHRLDDVCAKITATMEDTVRDAADSEVQPRAMANQFANLARRRAAVCAKREKIAQNLSDEGRARRQRLEAELRANQRRLDEMGDALLESLDFDGYAAIMKAIWDAEEELGKWQEGEGGVPPSLKELASTVKKLEGGTDALRSQLNEVTSVIRELDQPVSPPSGKRKSDALRKKSLEASPCLPSGFEFLSELARPDGYIDVSPTSLQGMYATHHKTLLRLCRLLKERLSLRSLEVVDASAIDRQRTKSRGIPGIVNVPLSVAADTKLIQRIVDFLETESEDVKKLSESKFKKATVAVSRAVSGTATQTEPYVIAHPEEDMDIMISEQPGQWSRPLSRAVAEPKPVEQRGFRPPLCVTHLQLGSSEISEVQLPSSRSPRPRTVSTVSNVAIGSKVPHRPAMLSLRQVRNTRIVERLTHSKVNVE